MKTFIVRGDNWEKKFKINELDYPDDKDRFDKMCCEAGTQAVESFFRYKNGNTEEIKTKDPSKKVSLGWILYIFEKNGSNPDNEMTILTQYVLENAGFSKQAKEQELQIKKYLEGALGQGEG
jgi:hypothetical protein